ncbi:ABC transporter substrate-binding protein [Ktedonospora formicarum]|uniref:Iron siderophore-binding protein n=1 Tax=Ktedonospora formicarum TaxID=2778364 RepID=A0A8J3HWW0_9CHLR|nr:iron-siderophore ABC transporter substrate-binding protein [Ktedonospora formicarum]GHO42510.1 iron siderophore-binding protein [Ktedonospora formicarum]
MKKLLTIFPICMLLVILFTACGGQTSTGSNGQGNDSGERVIKHAMGETKVSAHPQRVVVLDTGELDDAIALGVTPVGAVSALKDSGYMSYLQDKTKNIVNVGTISQPNLEKIASLNPDLILSSKMRHESIYDKLSQIAPTVFSVETGAPWKENFMLYANALNKVAEANALMQQYNQKIDTLKSKLGDNLSKTHVSIVRVLPDRVRLYMHQTFIGSILDDAGLPRPTSQDAQKKFAEEVSYENISSMDGDVIFLCNYGDSKAKLQELTNQPQWQKLQAVKNGKVFQVSDDLWMLGIGVGAATKVVDELTTDLTK